jgi:hypothetical protein
MNRDDIIRMATEARLIRSGENWTMPSYWGLEEVVAFAELVAAFKRESCARVCEKLANSAPFGGDLLIDAADHIRAC